ncbi:MAG: transposase [Bacillota bacterium]
MREGRKRLVRALRRVRPDKADDLAAWAEPLADTDFPDRDALLAAEMARGEALLQQLDDVADAEVDRLKAQYRAVLNGEGVASLTDPEARWGFQKKGEAFLGYKVVASCDEHGLVTAVTVVPGNESEVAQVKTLRAKWQRLRLRPRAVAADKAYDASTLRQELHDHGVRIYTPRKDRRSTLPAGFAYDPQTNQVTCPAGAAGQAGPHPRGGFLYVFSQRTCQRCPLKVRCLKGGQNRRVVYFHPGKNQDRPKGIRVAMRVRKTIERIFGEVKKWHRLDRARYQRLRGVAFQAVMTFFVLNTKKLSRWRPGQPVPQPA